MVQGCGLLWPACGLHCRTDVVQGVVSLAPVPEYAARAQLANTQVIMVLMTVNVWALAAWCKLHSALDANLALLQLRITST
jgi:hypothetical protein